MVTSIARLSAASVFALAICACGRSAAAPTSPALRSISAVASAQLNEIFGQMQARWYFSSTMNWPHFRATVLDTARNAQTIQDTFPAIKQALTLLGDKHSYYITSGGEFIFNPDSPSAFGACAANPAPPVPPVFADVGYVKIQVYLDGDRQARAADIQNAIRAQDRAGLAGWIVDMGNSHGGDMWTTLAGLGSILGDGISSSGEAITIAFRGRPNTRRFGSATCGLSTAIGGATLSNGAVLAVVTSLMADRTQRAYGGIVIPDELISDDNAMATRAVAWLRGQ